MAMDAALSARLRLAGPVRTVFAMLCVLMVWYEEQSSVTMATISQAMAVTCVWRRMDGCVVRLVVWLSVEMVSSSVKRSVMTATQPMDGCSSKCTIEQGWTCDD